MIKMIAMDYDWTLLDYSGQEPFIGKETIDLINRFINAGGYAGIVSGRQYWDFRGEFKSMGLPWAEKFPNYIIGREAYIYEVDGLNYTEFSEHNEKMHKNITALTRKMTAYLEDILTLYEKNNIQVTNFFVYGDFAVEIHTVKEDAQKAMELLSEFVKEKGITDAAVHRNGVMVTVYSKYAGKGKTLLAAAGHFGINPGEVLAIGDSCNDITMIDGKLGFVGACVGNAEDRVKEIVKAGGGYVGNGTAYKGIADILYQLKKDEKIEF